MYIFRGRGVFIDVYQADDKIATSGATSLADIDLQRTYRAIDSVATGRIPSLFCASTLFLLAFRKRKPRPIFRQHNWLNIETMT